MSHSCIICENKTQFYFSKEYPAYNLGKFDFYTCPNCGFTFSETMYSMSNNEWEKLNFTLHENAYHPEHAQKIHFKSFPPYLQQAQFFDIFLKSNLSPFNKNQIEILDYGSGVGSIFKLIMEKFYNRCVVDYEKYTGQSTGVQILKQNPNKKFDIVFSSALFEHIRSIEPIEEMCSLLQNNGILAIHTVITETVPNDPNWFYINFPLHCSLFTNNAMNILMKKFHFSYSVYCPAAKTWLLYKKAPQDMDKKIEIFNNGIFQNYLYGKNTFMDYWK